MNHHNLIDLKVLTISSCALSVQFLQIENSLKILALLLTIGYTLRRWYLLEKNKKDE